MKIFALNKITFGNKINLYNNDSKIKSIRDAHIKALSQDVFTVNTVERAKKLKKQAESFIVFAKCDAETIKNNAEDLYQKFSDENFYADAKESNIAEIDGDNLYIFTKDSLNQLHCTAAIKYESKYSPRKIEYIALYHNPRPIELNVGGKKKGSQLPRDWKNEFQNADIYHFNSEGKLEDYMNNIATADMRTPITMQYKIACRRNCVLDKRIAYIDDRLKLYQFKANNPNLPDEEINCDKSFTMYFRTQDDKLDSCTIREDGTWDCALKINSSKGSKDEKFVFLNSKDI